MCVYIYIYTYVCTYVSYSKHFTIIFFCVLIHIRYVVYLQILIYLSQFRLSAIRPVEMEASTQAVMKW